MIETPLFWVAVALASVVAGAVPGERARWRAGLLAALSLVVIGSVFRFGLRPLAVLVLTGVWVIVAARVTAALGHIGRALPLTLTIGPLFGVWVLGKEALALRLTHLRFLYVIGLSYLVIKAWTLLKDVRDRRVEHPDPLVIAGYLFFVPTFLAGPMHYFGEFDHTLRHPAALDGEALLQVIFRIATGLGKVLLLSPALMPVSLMAVHSLAETRPAALAVACLAYSVVIWSDFSGYTDIAIGTARLVGIETPENFRYPYLAVNIRDFWQRWHITFSRVLTGYLFVPLSRTLGPVLGSRWKFVMIVSYLATFLFCGFWHGPTVNFLLWGAYHGAGLIAYDLYRPWALKRRRRRSPAGLVSGRLRESCAVAFTLAYVSAGWIFFVLPVERMLR